MKWSTEVTTDFSQRAGNKFALDPDLLPSSTGRREELFCTTGKRTIAIHSLLGTDLLDDLWDTVEGPFGKVPCVLQMLHVSPGKYLLGDIAPDLPILCLHVFLCSRHQGGPDMGSFDLSLQRQSFQQPEMKVTIRMMNFIQQVLPERDMRILSTSWRGLVWDVAYVVRSER